MRFEGRLRREQILALRRRLILAAAALAAFGTVLPWGWTASVHDGDGQVILVLVAVGMFVVLRYREHRVGLMLAGEAALGVIVASTAIVHFVWGERGPGLALLLLAGPLWFAAAALPRPYLRWVAAAVAGADGAGDALAGSASSKGCPDCHQRIRLSARICRFCGFRFDSGVEWIELPALNKSGRSVPQPSAKSFVYRDDNLGGRVSGRSESPRKRSAA